MKCPKCGALMDTTPLSNAINLGRINMKIDPDIPEEFYNDLRNNSLHAKCKTCQFEWAPAKS